MNNTEAPSPGSLKRVVGPTDVNPYESEEYQRFVSEMAKHCQCRANNCPCDGVLAGGPCDMVQEEKPQQTWDDDE
jgi:hypothetical protein